MTTIRPYATARNREATAITTVLALPCGLACAGSVVPGIDDIVTTIVVGLAALALVALCARWMARRVRERREDAADTLTATRWRAAHAPHLLTPADRAHLSIHPREPALDVLALA
jgi:hypothetical protein